MIIKMKKGLSLVETIIYISIFSVLVVGLSTFVNSISNARINNQTLLEINNQGYFVSNIISQAIRNAISVTAPTISASSNSLTITTATPATNPTNFNLSGDILYITEGSNTPTALTNNKAKVSDLIFYNLSKSGKPSTIQFRFKVNNINFYGSGSLRK